MSFPVLFSAESVVAPVVAQPLVVCIPKRVSVGVRLVPSSSFVPAVAGVVTGCSAADERGLVVVVAGNTYRCLWSALGGRDSLQSVALIASCRYARASGVKVQLWVAPGKSGRPAAGYFCGIQEL
jgi:hypothetical protein